MLLTLIVSAIAVCSIQALSVSRRTLCGSGTDFLTENNGIIRSHTGMANNHTYGRYMDCIWKIEAPEGMMVELVAQSFDLESDSTCDNDYLILLDGKDSSAPSLGKFCGKTFSPITSSERFLTLRFITDGSLQYGGFEIFYNFTTTPVHTCLANQFMCTNGRCIQIAYTCDNADDCGDDSDEVNCTGCSFDQFNCNNTKGCIPRRWMCDGDNDCGDNADEIPSMCFGSFNDTGCGVTSLTGTSGTITSPRYPNNYSADAHCLFFIQAPMGSTSLSFNFAQQFQIESLKNCTYDYVSISTEQRRNIHGPFCGTTAPAQFTVPGDHAYVEFVSDHSSQYIGFSLDWNSNN